MQQAGANHNRPPAEVLFELDGIDLAYSNGVALKDVSLRIASGEKVALVGPSGAGKTTLLNKLYQLRAGSSALIHQHYALVPQLSVFHNIYIGRLDRHSFLFNALNLIRPQMEIRRQIDPILMLLGLQDKAMTRVGELSGGQQQRVAVGRALYRGSPVLLADEPVASVDVRQGEAIIKLIMETDKTVVAALHSVDFALRYAGRIIGLCDRRIHFDRPSGSVTPDMLQELYQEC